MPFCFAWGFAACVSLCAAHGAEPRDGSADAALMAGEDESHGDDHCPLPAALACALPERQTNAPAPHAGGDARATLAPSPAPPGFAPRLPARRLNPPSTADPPLERLGVLRI